MNRYQCPVCNATSDNKITDSCDECLPVFEEMMNKQHIINLFSGVINEESLDNLTPDELKSIETILTEAGY